MSLTTQAQRYLKSRAVKVLDRSTLKGIKLTTTSYVIFSNAQIVLGLFGGSKTESKSKNITWYTNKTNVTGGRLVLTASVDNMPSDMILKFNNQQVYRKDWGVLDSPDISERIDIGGLLQNGVNTVSVIGERPLSGATFTFSVTLEIDFEGITPPDVGDTIGGIPLTTIAIVAGVAGTFLLLLTVIVRRR